MSDKPIGLTPTETLLAQFCDRTFLKLWSYPNPHKEDGHELCDLLAVFGRYVFIFFDRESKFPEMPATDPQIAWDRWKRNVIDRQVKTAHGADRYIRSGRPIFLDGQRTRPFPFSFDRKQAVIHKVIIAHGATEACKGASPDNIYGSLAISYVDNDGGPSQPFHIEIDRRDPVHVLDSHNMPIVLSELDTVLDFAEYLDEKVRATASFERLSYCGEEDLLAHYLSNFHAERNRHVIGPMDTDFKSVMIGEGEWHDFSQSDLYKNTKSEDRVSYFWDELIQRTCKNALEGTLGGNSNIVGGQSAVYEMVKEPRFVRRGLADKMLSAVQRFPETGPFARQVTYLPSFQPNVGYVLLQVRAPDAFRAEPGYREKRQALLEIACGAAKNKFPRLVEVIGIGIDAPKFSRGPVAEDFILMYCDTWTDEMKAHYERENEPWQFFQTSDLQEFSYRVTRFVPLT